MIYALYFIHVVVALFLIMVVLLQQGKGADLSVFGGGATQAAFGARGAATLLHKLTVFGFVAFTLTTLSIGIIKSRGANSSVMTGVAVDSSDETAATEAEDAAATAAEPAAESALDAPPTEPAEDAAKPEAAATTEEATSTEAGDPSGN